jgi:hypothetical protein
MCFRFYKKRTQDSEKCCSLSEDFEDTKGVIRTHKSKKDIQHNGQKKQDLRTNNDLQDISHKTKDRVTRTSLRKPMEKQDSKKIME